MQTSIKKISLPHGFGKQHQPSFSLWCFSFFSFWSFPTGILHFVAGILSLTAPLEKIPSNTLTACIISCWSLLLAKELNFAPWSDLTPLILGLVENWTFHGFLGRKFLPFKRMIGKVVTTAAPDGFRCGRSEKHPHLTTNFFLKPLCKFASSHVTNA